MNVESHTNFYFYFYYFISDHWKRAREPISVFSEYPIGVYSGFFHSRFLWEKNIFKTIGQSIIWFRFKTFKWKKTENFTTKTKVRISRATIVRFKSKNKYFLNQLKERQKK